jgi:hypothetical protein
MKAKILSASLVLLAVGGWFGTATADETNAFQEVLGHYEAIRLALVNDTLEEVLEHAQAIEGRMTKLMEDFRAADAGVPEGESAACKALLPEAASAAELLASAEGLDQARAAFFELSKPLGRYRKLAGSFGTVVVSCPMAKKAWIQPEGEIGNPYMGQGMPVCGQVVAD